MDSANKRGPDESRDLIWPIESILKPFDLSRMFPLQQPLEVELGCGDSSFIVSYARSHPDRNFIGVERLKGRLKKLARKGSRPGLTNLLGVRIESKYFLRYLLPAESVAVIHVYFPDPWPKRKHRRHRLIDSDFPALSRRVLVKGGMVFLRTDNSDYFAQMNDVFAATPAFETCPAPSGLTEVFTDFERDFHARGVSTLHGAFRKIE